MIKIINKSKCPVVVKNDKISLFACENKTLFPGEIQSIGTGLFFEVPKQTVLQITGVFKNTLFHKVNVYNAPACVFNDDREEIRVILINNGDSPFIISKGDAIAFGFLLSLVEIQIQETEVLEKQNYKIKLND